MRDKCANQHSSLHSIGERVFDTCKIKAKNRYVYASFRPVDRIK
jgi:hypothetical protein